MARLNISLPDALYARLERLRDRLNASRVCAVALEKELDVVEGRPATAEVTEAQVDRLVERLRSARDRWYERGRQDGAAWAVERASAAELVHIGDEWADDDNYDLDQDDLPESFDLWDTLAKWEGHEGLEGDGNHLKAAYLRGWHYAIRDLWQAAKPRLR